MKIKDLLIISLFISPVLFYCEKKNFIPDNSPLPTVITAPITSITAVSASGGGNVINNGDEIVTIKGICWSINHNPTILLITKTENGWDVGNFISTLSNLSPNTRYYVRAYATSLLGTGYGSEVSFITKSDIINGASYYVSPTGDDSNPGTINKPWATWQKGFNSISPGNILYIRGGTYKPTAITQLNGRYCGVAISGKNGTSDSKYTVLAYPGEKPILDGSKITSSGPRYGIQMSGCSYWNIKGIEISNVNQSSNGGGQGLIFEDCSYCIAENIVSHHNNGPGMGTRLCDEILFLNCDAYSNYDPLTGGDDADGFDIGFQSNNSIIRLTGCRAWNNSDDGFDMYQMSEYSGIYYLTNCWSWKNGYKTDGITTSGDGNGFKYGDDPQSYSGVTKRFTYNCIAYANRTRGYSQESARVKKEFYNNISYDNKAWGWSFGYAGDGSAFEVGDILRNNIAFDDGVENLYGGTNYADRISDHNSWDSGGPTITSADFISTDMSQLDNPRQSNGNLPKITALHLAGGSDAIGKGVSIPQLFYDGDGMSWKNPPSLGAFEY